MRLKPQGEQRWERKSTASGQLSQKYQDIFTGKFHQNSYTRVEKDEDDDVHNSLAHVTDKPFSAGRKYVISGFVHDMTDTKSDDHYFVRAHVWPSMKSDLPHNVTIILFLHSCAVIHASCVSCKASELGRWSHVVAALLSIVDHVKIHSPKTTTPCTSKECTWIKGRKKEKEKPPGTF